MNVPDIPSTSSSLHNSQFVPHFKIAAQCHLVQSQLSLVERWHQRLGHSNYQRIRHMLSRDLISGVPQLPTASHIQCEACIKGKHNRHRIPKQATNRATRPLELVHSDLCGPFPASLTGSRYFITFTDDYSRFSWVYFLKFKSEALDKFKAFKQQIETSLGARLMCLCTDRGGEYMSDLFKFFCQQHGITRQLTVAKTPHQNGVVERKNRTLLDILRSMAITSRAPASLWEEYLATANYINNRCSTRALNLSTPFESITNLKPDLCHLRIIGSTAYVHIPKDMRSKLYSKTMSAILVGYDSNSKAYRCFDPLTKKILISKDILFYEDTMGNFFPTQLAPPETLFEIVSSQDNSITSSPSTTDLPTVPHQQEDNENEVIFEPAQDQIQAEDLPSTVPAPLTHHLPPAPTPGMPTRPRSTRLTSRPYKLSDYHLYLANQQADDTCMALLAHSSSNVDLNEAFSHPDWCAAMQQEMEAHSRNHTCDLTTLPPGAKALSAR